MKRLPILLVAILLCCALGPTTAAVAEPSSKIVLELDGEVYRATVHPAPLPVGEVNYRGYYDRLWGLTHDLGRTLNALSPSLGDGLLALVEPMETPPQEATLTVGKDGVEIAPDVKGRGYDRYRLGLMVATALDGERGEPLTKTDVEADVTQKGLEAITKVIGRYVTRYDGSNASRAHNLRLACGALSGRVIQPDERLSFNAAVGERNENRGYLPAPVVQDGAYTQGIGGGVCQVSTTLYNAALRAGLAVEESHPHTLTAHYVGAGWDAMVSGWSDLVIRNTTSHPVYLFAKAEGGTLSVKILGEPQGAVKLWASDPVVTPAPRVDEEGRPLLSTDGYCLVRKGQDGLSVTTYRSIDGEKERLRRSSYPSVPFVYRQAPQEEEES